MNRLIHTLTFPLICFILSLLMASASITPLFAESSSGQGDDTGTQTNKMFLPVIMVVADNGANAGSSNKIDMAAPEYFVVMHPHNKAELITDVRLILQKQGKTLEEINQAVEQVQANLSNTNEINSSSFDQILADKTKTLNCRSGKGADVSGIVSSGDVIAWFETAGATILRSGADVCDSPTGCPFAQGMRGLPGLSIYKHVIAYRSWFTYLTGSCRA